jgi:chromosome segregation ATPase
MRRSLVLVVVLLISSTALVQTAPTELQTLQALLAEVRQLRHDLQTSTATAQRAQIALYRLQRQDEAVARANQRLSDARSGLANVVSTKNALAVYIQQADATAESSQNAEARIHFEQVELPGLKSRLETSRREEQEAQAREVEAEQQLREEQAKLDALNDTLDRLNAALEDVSRR